MTTPFDDGQRSPSSAAYTLTPFLCARLRRHNLLPSLWRAVGCLALDGRADPQPNSASSSLILPTGLPIDEIPPLLFNRLGSAPLLVYLLTSLPLLPSGSTLMRASTALHMARRVLTLSCKCLVSMTVARRRLFARGTLFLARGLFGAVAPCMCVGWLEIYSMHCCFLCDLCFLSVPAVAVSVKYLLPEFT